MLARPCRPALRPLPLLLVLGAAPARAQDFLYGVGGFTNSQSGDRLGAAVTWLGDVDGDQRDDFAAAAPSHLSNSGRVFVLSGRTGATLYGLTGAFGARLGTSLTSLQDLDGDQVRELVIGSRGATPAGGPAQAGRVAVVSGATGAPLFEIGGTAANGEAGVACATIADLDGDAVEDLLVGHFGGRITLHSGATGALLREHVGPGPLTDRFGWSLCALGDVDLDGTWDYAAGAPSDTSGAPGRVQVYSGATGQQLWRVDGVQGDRLGASLARLADLDGDAVPELLTGAVADDFPALGYGTAWILSGATGAVLRRVDGVDSNGATGAAVASLGDLDGDGQDEYAVSAPAARFYVPTQRTGSVHVYHGATGAPLYALSGVGEGDRFGDALAAGGDLDGDGAGDLLVGATGMDHHGTGGAVRVHVGARTGAFTNYCVGKLNSLGCVPRLAATGSPSWSGGDDLTVHAHDVLPGSPGFFFLGLEDRQRLTVAGYVCIESGFRTPIVVSANGGASPCPGVLSFRLDSAFLAPRGMAPGVRLHVQAWYRDPAHPDGRGVGLSDGLGFTVCP